MRRVNFDLDVLRSFVTGIDLGGFSKAADRLGRSTSAVSAQLRKLEEQAGTAIFRKSGRGLALTDAGETMLAYARRLLELNDEAVAALGDVNLEGRVRLGLQEDFGDSLLPEVLGRFARSHPKVKIEVRVARNMELVQRVTAGSLDLALAWGNDIPGPYSERLLELPMRWIGPSGGRAVLHEPGEPIPLVVFDAPCQFRSAAMIALDRAGIPWRVAFSSPNLSGLWAAVAAGLGYSVRTPLGLPASVRTLEPGEAGLPGLLPEISLALVQGESELEPSAARLAGIVVDAVRGVAGQRKGVEPRELRVAMQDVA